MATAADERRGPLVLNWDSLKHYVDTFNQNDEELYIQHISNERACEFLKENIPLFSAQTRTSRKLITFGGGPTVSTLRIPWMGL